MQRLFSMFPSGLPGLGLLLLRGSVATALLLDVHGHHPLFGWIPLVSLLLAGVLLAGFLTPFAAASALALHGLIWAVAGIGSAVMATIVCLNALALTLLGPGGYSVDAYLFGRRVLVLPPP